jgi:flagellar biosynthetic protein FliO
MGGKFVLVIALLVAVLWLLRRARGLQGMTSAPKRISIVETVSLGARHRLMLLTVDSRELLVGSSPASLTMIELSAPEARRGAALRPADSSAAQTPDFRRGQ